MVYGEPQSRGAPILTSPAAVPERHHPAPANADVAENQLRGSGMADDLLTWQSVVG